MRHIIRDPVHHTIVLSADERQLIDHPLFQRLRRIKQTAFLSLIFPGSTHDRFSHSIGVMHMGGQIFDSIAEDFVDTFGPRALQPTQKEYFRRLIRLAALLHDIGHGPFSHSLEGVTHAGRTIHPTRKALFECGSIPNHWIDEKIFKLKGSWLDEPAQHEEFSIALIARIAEEKGGRIAGVWGQDIASLIADWVVSSNEFMDMDKLGPSGKWNLKPALKSMVSGEIDCDRMDYLLRDSLYTGVPYGQYDKDMLISNIIWRPHPDKPTQLALGIRRKALHAFEDFLTSRFHMFMQLYSHKAAVGFDIVLENALAELPDFHIHPDLKEYVTWSDDWLLRKILENRSSRWGAHIRDRVGLKHLFTVREEDQKLFEKFIKPYELSAGTTAWFPSLKTRNTERVADVQGESTPKIWWRKSVNYLTKEKRGSMPLFIEDKLGNLIPAEEISLLLKSDFTRKFEMIHVYALRDEEKDARRWLISKQIPSKLYSPPKDLLS